MPVHSRDGASSLGIWPGGVYRENDRGAVKRPLDAARDTPAAAAAARDSAERSHAGGLASASAAGGCGAKLDEEAAAPGGGAHADARG